MEDGDTYTHPGYSSVATRREENSLFVDATRRETFERTLPAATFIMVAALNMDEV